MGEHTELMVKDWEISRDEQDEIAYWSHVNADRATEDGRLPEKTDFEQTDPTLH